MTGFRSDPRSQRILTHAKAVAVCGSGGVGTDAAHRVAGVQRGRIVKEDGDSDEFVRIKLLRGELFLSFKNGNLILLRVLTELMYAQRRRIKILQFQFRSVGDGIQLLFGSGRSFRVDDDNIVIVVHSIARRTERQNHCCNQKQGQDALPC